jgi:hypothetical protein
MNNRAEVGPIGALVLFGVFLVIWGVGLAPWISSVGASASASLGGVGIEAFFYDNLNLLILIIVIIAMVAWSYFGGRQ